MQVNSERREAFLRSPFSNPPSVPLGGVKLAKGNLA